MGGFKPKTFAICVALLCACGATMPLRGQTGAIVPVTLSNTLAANDDDSTDAVLLNIGGTNGINFFGQSFKRVYVNNNGNLTFGSSLSQFTPNGLAQGVGYPIIAPFFADVDTTGTGSGLVQYGNATVNGYNAFVANYINVGYFASETDKLNSFQVILIDRSSDVGAGDFDIEFNYGSILWETGDASGGTDGLGGTSVAVGYSNGLSGSQNVYFQLPGSLINGALINGGPNALISHSVNSTVPGRYIFPVRQGAVTLFVSSLACVPGILGQSGVGTCTITLTGNAPAGGAAVTLSSSSTALSVPASVTVPAGQNTVTFSATASAGLASNQTATVTATYGGNSQTANIAVTTAVQNGYIGVFYNSTPPKPCPTAISALCTANTTVNNNLGGVQDGPVFVFVNTSSTPITNGVLTILGVDFFDVGTIGANSTVTVIPGVSDDKQNHGSNNFFTVTGSIYDSSDNFASLNSTQFKFTGQQGSTQIVSVDVCGIVAPPNFTPACTAGPSNDGTVPNINFLGGPGDNDGPCNNCFGPAIVADLDTSTGLPAPSPVQIPGGGGASQVTLPGGTVGVPYSQALPVSNGTPPYTWTLLGGALPKGLSLNSAGTLSGTPSQAGSAVFSARVTDASGNVASSTFLITIAPQPVTITTVSPLPNGIVGSAYPAQIMSATGGSPPYTFQIFTSGALPGGLTFSGGELSGIPTASGSFTFTVTATDSSQATGTAQFQLTVQPTQTSLILSQASVAFSLNVGATGLPSGANVSVRSSVASQPLTYSISVTPAVTWLDVTGGGSTPGTIGINLDPKALSLGAGTSSTSIIVSCGAPGIAAGPCSGASQTIKVTLTVAAASPQLSITNSVLSFSSQTSNPQPISQTLGLQNTGGGSITVNSITAANSYVTISGAPATIGGGPAVPVTVTVNPTGLAAGFYQSSVLVNTSAGSSSVPVTLLVAQNPPMTLSPAGVQFQASAGAAPGNPNGSFQVTVSGSSTVNWNASLLPGASWLTLNTSSGSSTAANPGSVSFSVNASAASLAPQAYYAQIQVTSSGVVNSPQSFVVILNVAPAANPVLPDPEPPGLLFISAETGALAPQTVQVYASSASPVNYQAASDSSWLLVSPASGSTSSASPAPSSVSVNLTGLASGVYRGNVSYAFSSAAVRTVNVTLIVNAGASTAAERTPEAALPNALPRASCTPTQLVPTQTGLVNNFAEPTAWPTPLAVLLVNDCGQPVLGAQVVATFSNGDPPLGLSATNTTSGIYSGTWTPRNAAGQVTISARATASSFPAANVQITGQVTPNAAPLLTLNGTLNAFAIAAEPGVPVAPGTIVQIYGANLASQVTQASTIPLPTSLNQTSVIIGGLLAPLYYVSPGQINAQVPFELAAGSPYQVIVSANGALSTPNPLQLTADAPGIAQFATGAIIAQHLNGSLVLETSPAAPGEYIVIYVAGMGLTNQNVPSGTASPSTTLAASLDAATLTLNGAAVTNVLFAGLTPTLVGLYQIDFQVPANAPNGDLLLVLTQTSGVSNSAVLPVHN
jgi:uncharacterized protein (TIGR03437 family)